MQSVIDYLVSRVSNSFNQATRLVVLTMIATVTKDYFDGGRKLSSLKKSTSSRLKNVSRAVNAKNLTKHEIRKYRVMIDAYRDILDIIDEELEKNGD